MDDKRQWGSSAPSPWCQLSVGQIACMCFTAPPDLRADEDALSNIPSGPIPVLPEFIENDSTPTQRLAESVPSSPLRKAAVQAAKGVSSFVGLAAGVVSGVNSSTQQQQQQHQQLDRQDGEEHNSSEAGCCSHDAGAQSGPGSLIVSMVLNGRLIGAWHAVEALQREGGDPLQFLGTDAFERLQRVNRRFAESLEGFLQKPDEEWRSEAKDSFDFTYSYKTVEGGLHVESSSEHHDEDALSAFVALCEVDLWCGRIIHDVLSVKPLGDQKPGESLWRVLKGGVMEDNLMEAHCGDALAEHGLLWVCLRAVVEPEGRTEMHGVPLPRLDRGYHRSEADYAVFMIHPLQAGTSRSFRLTCKRFVCASAFWRKNFTVWTKAHVRKDTARLLSEIVTLSQSEAVERRFGTSEAAPFFEQVRRRLQGGT
eukprot:NODE_5999_length_1713_cov_14.453972.p1 GENE.NODE_5999_length_1713_cov_14.453972~~NODE_5999_length_1713_cov_14.453972.p1  ORF type:complete len:424 (+),score=97.26 NODE_5999_length_1713_cov_14.453972:106-1377(+)